MSVVAPDSVPKIAWLQNFASEQRQQTFPWCWPLVGCTVVLLLQQEAVSLHLGTKPPHAWLVSPTFLAAAALASFALTSILVPPTERTRILVVGLSLEAFRVCVHLLAGRPPLNLVVFPGFGLGVAAWCFLAYEAMVGHGHDGRRARGILAGALVLPLGNVLMWPALLAAIPFLPDVYDLALIRLDATLGLQPASVIATLFQDFPLLHAFHVVVYFQLALAMGLVAALEARSGRRMGVGLLPAALAAAVIGYALYAAMPALGPRPYFGDGFARILQDFAAPPAEPLVNTTHPRNAIPSLHMTWALLVYLAARRQGRWARAGAACFAFCTALATLGLGEHYFVDLVAAAPLVLLARAICASDVPLARPDRWTALALGSVLLVGWCLVVRGIVDPVAWHGLTPALMAATVLACYGAERALFRAETGMRGAEIWRHRVAAE
jgi:PAP2 superfamily protein